MGCSPSYSVKDGSNWPSNGLPIKLRLAAISTPPPNCECFFSAQFRDFPNGCLGGFEHKTFTQSLSFHSYLYETEISYLKSHGVLLVFGFGVNYLLVLELFTECN